jgi:hypothetical protein
MVAADRIGPAISAERQIVRAAEEVIYMIISDHG